MPAECANDPPRLVMVGLLGSFRLLKQGRPVSFRAAGGKIQNLLGLLAIRPAGVRRSVLLQALWPDSEPALAAQSLNSLVHASHKLLADGLGGAEPIVHDADMYRLNYEAGIEVDADRFCSLLASAEGEDRAGRRESAMGFYRQAVDLYNGDLCLDADFVAIVERERLRASYLSTLAHLADYSWQREDVSSCLAIALRMLTTDPCREDAHRLMMRCYLARGERIQALRQYHLCQEILRADLATEPEAATTLLYESARSAAGGAGPGEGSVRILYA